MAHGQGGVVISGSEQVRSCHAAEGGQEERGEEKFEAGLQAQPPGVFAGSVRTIQVDRRMWNRLEHRVFDDRCIAPGTQNFQREIFGDAGILR